MNSAQEAEIKFKRYEGLNDDDPSVMQISSIPHLEVMVSLETCKIGISFMM